MAVERNEKGQVKKGSVLNPRGKPKGTTNLTNILRAIGDEKYDETGIKNKTLLARKMWQMAIDGNTHAAKIIYDRCEGQPRQSIELESTGKMEVIVDWPESSDQV